MRLRPYQSECVNACLKRLQSGVHRQAVSLPVGSGKTVVFSNLIKRIPPPTGLATKTLVLAHREELLYQAARQIQRAAPNIIVDIDRGTSKANPAADVIVASVPTLGRRQSERLERYEPKRYKCIVIDEAHHAAAETYTRIIDYFCGKQGANDPEKNEGIVVWGCSATLRRYDGLGLSRVFDEIVYHKPFLEMIKEGWLSNLKLVTVRTSSSLGDVKRYAGDFSIGSLSSAVNNMDRNLAVVKSYHTLAAGRRSVLVFAVDVAHARELCGLFVSYGIPAEVVLGHTPANERDRILEGFRSGEIPVLINCGILTEGTDIPNIDCVMMARPTRSPVLFQQMVGRGMRLSDGKKDCLIIDFVDMFREDTGLVTLPTLLGLDPALAFKKTDILDSSAIDELVRAHQEERDKKSVSGDGDRETVGHQQIMESFESELDEARSLDSLESLEAMGFKARLHLNPLNFFDLSVPAANISTGKYVSDLDAVSCGDLRLRQMSRLSWVSLSQGKFLLSFSGTLYFVTKNEADGLWYGSKRVRMKKPLSSKPGAPPKLVYFYTAEKDIGLVSDSLQHAIHGVDKLVAATAERYEQSILLWRAPWRQKPPTPGQIKSLERLGVSVPDSVKLAASRSEPPRKSSRPVSEAVVTAAEATGAGAKESMEAKVSGALGRSKKIAGITRGSAANLILRLTHGSARAWRNFEKASQRLEASQAKRNAEAAKKAEWLR
ncbi:P-loop containing nucleoside triphosphate hydrolase protein [Martensiomyces pterosporus]|nr:P-loop containing nucleoside triphosphate hydrolase protein [Martensiomyces pterosporus]